MTPPAAAAWVADRIGADVAEADRAAELAKADLLTGMVGEFPELQGVMGGYYALHDGEPAQVAVLGRVDRGRVVLDRDDRAVPDDHRGRPLSTGEDGTPGPYDEIDHGPSLTAGGRRQAGLGPRHIEQGPLSAQTSWLPGVSFWVHHWAVYWWPLYETVMPLV